MTVATPSTCQCTTLKDFLGNQLNSCSCPVAYPVQYTQDQQCACQRVTNVLTNSSVLSCTNCSVATAAKPVILAESQCQCLNSFDFAMNRTFLDCVCSNVTQCVDPASFAKPVTAVPVAPCKISYPCSCAQNGTSNLTCQCSNQGVSATLTQPSSQCACQTVTNVAAGTFQQACQCCIADEFVRKNLFAPVTCPKASDLKETCLCRNQTISNNSMVSTLSCDCQHPISNVVSNNIQYPSEGLCDCDNYTIGTKTCKCCVAIDIQIQ